MTGKLDVRDIIAGRFDKGNHGRCPEHEAVQASRDEVKLTLNLMGFGGISPIFKG